jgi:hypothetical protein
MRSRRRHIKPQDESLREGMTCNDDLEADGSIPSSPIGASSDRVRAPGIGPVRQYGRRLRSLVSSHDLGSAGARPATG